MPLDHDELDHMVGRPWIHRVPPACTECGYNLTGLTSGRCPECGTPVQRRAVEQAAREVSAEVARLKGINDVPKAGLVIGFATAGLVALFAAVGFSASARLFGLLGGVVAFGLGLSVLRAMRVPREALELLPFRPAYATGIGSACLGVLLILLAVVMP